MRLFLDSTVALAASGRATGASRAIFDLADKNGWQLLTSRYVLQEVAKNLTKLPPAALTNWPILARKLVVARDVWTMDRPAVFQAGKDRPILFTAAAWATILLTLDRADFRHLAGSRFYHLQVMSPGSFLETERAAGRLK